MDNIPCVEKKREKKAFIEAFWLRKSNATERQLQEAQSNSCVFVKQGPA